MLFCVFYIFCKKLTIPLNGNGLNFTAPANSNSALFIGLSDCAPKKPFSSRLTVFADNSRNAGVFTNLTNSTAPTTGVAVTAQNNNGDAIGVNVTFNGTGTGFNATGVNSNLSVNNAQNIALNGAASNATTNYGVYAAASGGTTNYAGYFNGDVARTGSDNFTSDQKLKQNIDTISNALNTIMQLKPKTFTYQQSAFPSMNLPSGKQYGLIAQDVQTVLPELVNNNIHPAVRDSLGNVVTPAVSYLSLEYQQLTGIMIKAMQQQQAHINHQDSVINQLTSAINSCCSNNGGNGARTANINVQSTELSDAAIVVLNQNQPNPFAEQTTITYNIPQSAGAAQILFYDVNGKQIQNVAITTKGKGQLNVYANDLTNGVYSYTLIVDGKIIDTKKMIKQQ